MSIEIFLIGLNLLVTLVIGFLNSYSSEKGKNLATKEDVEEITRKVESTKNIYIADIERLKVELATLSRKKDLLFDERIRVFKNLQKTLVEFKKYCNAFLGTFDERGEFHPTLETLNENLPQSSLVYLTKIQDVLMEDFIFLSDGSKSALNHLYNTCKIMPTIEIYLSNVTHNEKLDEGELLFYEEAIFNIDKCLQRLYEELNFPNLIDKNNSVE